MSEDYMLIFAGVVVVVPAIFLIVWLTSRGKKWENPGEPGFLFAWFLVSTPNSTIKPKKQNNQVAAEFSLQA